MQFGMYLYRNGIINADQLLKALELQTEELVPLGVLAMEQGTLAARDVLSVLRVQSDLPSDRFGDIAIELGLMTRRDLAELLMLQSDRKRSLADCLVELGFVTKPQRDEELAAFRRERERGGTGGVRRVAAHLPPDLQQELASR